MDVQSKLLLMSENGSFPGATYGILFQGESCFGSVGVKAVYPKLEANHLETLYDVASLTKVIVTNTIISKLKENGIVDWYDPITKYLKWFPYSNITLYHLLTHTSGLKSLCKNKILTLYDVWQRLSSLVSVSIPGKVVDYADHNFILLGWIIEEIYHDSLDNIAYKEVFEPLDMSHTGYCPVDVVNCAPTEVTVERGIIRGVVHDEKAYYSNRCIGHAGVFSDVKDLAKFVEMVLNDGRLDEKNFLKKETIDCWFQPLEHDEKMNFRGIGWLVGNVYNITGGCCSENSVCHTGFTGTTIIIDRDNQLGIIFLSNRIHPSRENCKLLTERRMITELVYDQLQINKVKVKK